MPIYEYECPRCGERIELRLGIFEAPDGLECRCGGTARKLVSSFSFTFAEPKSKINPRARLVRR